MQTDAILNAPKLLVLIAKSTMGVYGSDDGRPVVKGTCVRVIMNNGDVYEHTQDANTMHSYPEREFLIGKFMDQFRAFGRLPDASGRKIVDLALNIESVRDMREYTELLVLHRRRRGKATGTVIPRLEEG